MNIVRVVVIIDFRNHCNRCFIRNENQPLERYKNLKNVSYYL